MDSVHASLIAFDDLFEFDDEIDDNILDFNIDEAIKSNNIIEESDQHEKKRDNDDDLFSSLISSLIFDDDLEGGAELQHEYNINAEAASTSPAQLGQPLAPHDTHIISDDISPQNHLSSDAVKSKTVRPYAMNDQAFLTHIPQLIACINAKDIPSMVKLLYLLMHHRCLFRIHDGTNIIEHTGSNSVVSFFLSLLSIYPDASVVVKRKIPKVFVVDQFKVIQIKVDFIGTEVMWLSAKQLLSPASSEFVSDMMNLEDTFQQEAMRKLEESIRCNGQRRHIHIRALVTIYIDPKLGRGVLGDITFKVTELAPS